MTTFANPFNPLHSMQAPEDSMEVSVDQERKSAMTMEEDNLDIDLEIDDRPEDEDSMMDDEPADADQQMDDDFQGPREQDDEVLDFVENSEVLVEIPMVEDGPQATLGLNSGQPTQVFPGILPENSEPQVPALQSQQIQSAQDENIQVAQEPLSGDQGQDAKAVGLAVPHEMLQTLEHIESIRNLYEEPPTEEPIDGTREPQEPRGDSENQSLDPNKAPSDHTKSTNHEAAAYTEVHKEATPEQPSIPKALDDSFSHNTTDHDPNKDQASEEKATGIIESEEADNDQTQETSYDEDEPRDSAKQPISETERAENHHLGNEAITEPIGIVVTCQGQQMSLFPPLEEHGTPETYLLSDHNLANDPIRSLLSACTGLLADSMAEHEEIELSMPTLKLYFREHIAEAEHYSIRDISDLHYQLHQNDGVESPEPLHILLEVKTRVSGHIDYLYTLAAEGKGMRFLKNERNAKDQDIADNPDVNVATDYQLSTNTANEVEVNAQNDYGDDDDDEFGEPDLPHGELDFDGLDEDNKGEDEDEDENSTEGPAGQQLSNESEPHDNEPNDQDFLNESFVEPPQDRPQVDVEEEEKREEDAKTTHEVAESDLTGDNADAGSTHNEQPTSGIETEQLDELKGAAAEEAGGGGGAQVSASEPLVSPSQSSYKATQSEDAAEDTSGIFNETSSNTRETLSTSKDNNDTIAAGEETNTAPIIGAEIFDDDYDEVNDFGDGNDGFENSHFDLGFEEQPPNTPQSLKRSRTAVDEVGEDAEDDDGHQLKRTRSG